MPGTYANSHERRIDLDWLRIGLFFLLILYHVGMFYVPWQWHVKSQYVPAESLQYPMLMMNPWRIPALFIISGIALRFALDKATVHRHFLRRRFNRLILPVLFGMMVVCAPQAYFELKQDGVNTGNLLVFYTGYLMPPWASPGGWTTITPTWNHLWYVVYVLLLSIVIIVASALSKGRLQNGLDRLISACCRYPLLMLLMPTLVSFFILWLLQNSVDAVQMVWGDWHRLVNSLWLMLFGFAIAKHRLAWEILWRFKWLLLCMTVVLGLIQSLDIQQKIWAEPQYDAYYYITRNFYGWTVMLSLFAFVQALPRGPDKLRNYLNNAVFPYYVIHQTIIIVAGVFLTRHNLGLLTEMSALVLITAVATALFYHYVIRHMGTAAVLLGGKAATH